MEQSEVYGSARPYATLVTVDRYVWVITERGPGLQKESPLQQQIRARKFSATAEESLLIFNGYCPNWG